MDNRGDLISLIGKYGRECMVTTESVTDDIARRSAAMKAIEDFCDAAILAERNACAAIGNEVEREADKEWRESNCTDDNAEGVSDGAVLIVGRILARPAP